MVKQRNRPNPLNEQPPSDGYSDNIDSLFGPPMEEGEDGMTRTIGKKLFVA